MDAVCTAKTVPSMSLALLPTRWVPTGVTDCYGVGARDCTADRTQPETEIRILISKMLRAFLGPALDLFIAVQVAHHESVPAIRQLSLTRPVDAPTSSGMQRHCSAHRSEIAPATDTCSHLQSRANFEASGMVVTSHTLLNLHRVNFAAYVPVFKCGSRLKPWKCDGGISLPAWWLSHLVSIQYECLFGRGYEWTTNQTALLLYIAPK